MTKSEMDEVPVMMVIGEDEKLIHVGDFDTFDELKMKEYLREGCTLKAIKYKEYKALNPRLYKKIK